MHAHILKHELAMHQTNFLKAYVWWIFCVFCALPQEKKPSVYNTLGWRWVVSHASTVYLKEAATAPRGNVHFRQILEFFFKATASREVCQL